MIRVTICAYDKPDNVGGPVSWIRRLLPLLRDRGVEVRCLFVMHWGDSGPALTPLLEAGFDCRWTNLDTTEARIGWILDDLRANPPDIFVPNLVVAGYYAARWAREAGIPTVGILHSDDPFYHGILDTFVYGRGKWRLSSVVCVSEELKRAVLARGQTNVRVDRIPYGVNIPTQHVRRKPGILRLAFAGRFAEEQKRIGEVTRALCAAASLSGVEAVMYGDGPNRALVEHILQTVGASLPVHLGGLVDSETIQTRMLETDVVVLLSDYEGLPIALLEAMACGCVPVCLAIRSGIPELVEHEVSGLLVNDRGQAFVEAIRRLRDDARLWQYLSDGAKSAACAFSSATSADHWARHFAELVEPRIGGVTVPHPRRLDLPPVHPALASADQRFAAPSIGSQLRAGMRSFLGGTRRRLRG